MKKLSIILGLTIFFAACNLIENKENKAIEICQKATDNTLSSGFGLDAKATWLDFANMLAKNDPNKKYYWNAKSTNELNIYIVSFTDKENWGHQWEVNIEQQIVKHINVNAYLCRKYGMSRFDNDSCFEIVNKVSDTLLLEIPKYYSKGKEIIYYIKASLINRTDKTFTSASILGKLNILFKDKTIIEESNWEYGFDSRITKSNPWRPGDKISFSIKTTGIEDIYMNYDPEYVYFELSLKAEDPIGFVYDKNIAEYDLKNSWNKLKNNENKN